MEPAVITDLQQRLARAQAKARRLRTEAFVRYSPIVAGEQLNAVTLDTYNLLLAWENPFVCGGPCEFVHVFQFIWAHHPEFSQRAEVAKQAVLRRVLRAVEPRRPILNLISRAFSPVRRLRWLARFREDTADELLQAAVDECARLVVEAIGEFPTDRKSTDPKSGALPQQLPFSMQAQVLGFMWREFEVPFHITRELPLKELSQHLREAAWVSSRGKVTLINSEEEAIWHEYEAATEAAINAQAAATT